MYPNWTCQTIKNQASEYQPIVPPNPPSLPLNPNNLSLRVEFIPIQSCVCFRYNHSKLQTERKQRTLLVKVVYLDLQLHINTRYQLATKTIKTLLNVLTNLLPGANGEDKRNWFPGAIFMIIRGIKPPSLLCYQPTIVMYRNLFNYILYSTIRSARRLLKLYVM